MSCRGSCSGRPMLHKIWFLNKNLNFTNLRNGTEQWSTTWSCRLRTETTTNLWYCNTDIVFPGSSESSVTVMFFLFLKWLWGDQLLLSPARGKPIAINNYFKSVLRTLESLFALLLCFIYDVDYLHQCSKFKVSCQPSLGSFYTVLFIPITN